jgi:hypothetical protein
MIKKWNDFVNEEIFLDVTDSEMLECPDCNGECYIECDAYGCNKGLVKCEECNGSGSLYCEDCGGDGCDGCDDGMIECTECYGNCDVDCNNCDGLGDKKCVTCDGSGEIDDNEEYDDDDCFGKGVTDLSLELEYKLRTLDDDSEYDFDQFFDEFGVKNPSDFAVAAILKGREEYKNMSDDEFFELYKNSKDNG